ncbi:hypothetical protein MCP_2206 [Methanocella paludicola SANAE]|uniref:Uncharacterized protein n=1 Tax=Methanocella paludicola (strain DSM 17711 / JCM 13418 / NBRC 101707 / SANAE) TaxID=304371 RepID=D1Z0Q6_METPS|nr:hypothetical protein MCP_2206 [Methanocella paludicola SANAE]
MKISIYTNARIIISKQRCYHQMVHTIEAASGLIEVRFEIYESDGYLCASGVGTSIHTWAKTWNKLMKNIQDAVKLYYNMPP